MRTSSRALGYDAVRAIVRQSGKLCGPGICLLQKAPGLSAEGGKYPSAMLVKRAECPGCSRAGTGPTGTVRVMAVSAEDALAYDSTLPPMEKHWQPSQENSIS